MQVSETLERFWRVECVPLVIGEEERPGLDRVEMMTGVAAEEAMAKSWVCVE